MIYNITSNFINSLIYTSITAVSAYFVYIYRYDCLYNIFVYYAWFKRKSNSIFKNKRIQLSVSRTIDFTKDCLNPRHGSNNIVSIPLFPYIKTIHFSKDASYSSISTDTFYQALKDYTIKYDTNKTYSEQRICLYNHITTEFIDLPYTITVVLDKPLLDLLNIKLPVRSSTGDAVYQLSADSIEYIDLP